MKRVKIAEIIKLTAKNWFVAMELCEKAEENDLVKEKENDFEKELTTFIFNDKSKLQFCPLSFNVIK